MSIQATVLATKTPRKEGEWVKIQVRLNWSYQRASFPLHVIEAKHWDAKNKLVKKVRGNDELERVRRDVQNKVDFYEDKWRELDRLMPGFTAAEFKAYVSGELDPLNKTTMTFLSWVEEHIDNFDDKLLPGKTYKGATNTKKKYQGSLKYLKLFAEETGEELTWANMNHEFVAKLKKWRLSKGAYYMRNRDNTDPVSHNTIAKLVKDVRGWITRARKMGVHDFRHTDHAEWSITAADPLRFALSKQQLQDFFAHPLPDGSWKQDASAGFEIFLWCSVVSANGSAICRAASTSSTRTQMPSSSTSLPRRPRPRCRFQSSR